MITVLADDRVLGFLLNRGPCGWEAFTADERSLGIYGTQAEAADAVINAEAAI